MGIEKQRQGFELDVELVGQAPLDQGIAGFSSSSSDLPILCLSRIDVLGFQRSQDHWVSFPA